MNTERGTKRTGRRSRCASLMLATVLAVMLSPVLWGHEDPRGETGPTVFTVDGKFLVCFGDNTVRDTDQRTFYRLIDTEGKVVLDRSPIDTAPEIKTFRRGGMLSRPNTVSGLVFSEGQHDPKKNPRVWTQTWKGTPPGDLSHCYESRGDTAVFHFTPRNENSFYFAAWDLAKKRLIAKSRIGTPGRIYSFAVASSPHLVEDTAYIAWIETQNFKREKAPLSDGTNGDIISYDAQLVLSRWRLGSDQVAHLPITRVTDVNVSVDLAHINNRILIARHERRPGNSKIVTELVDLDSAIFARDLPLTAIQSDALRSFHEFSDPH